MQLADRQTRCDRQNCSNEGTIWLDFDESYVDLCEKCADELNITIHPRTGLPVWKSGEPAKLDDIQDSLVPLN